MPYESMPIKSDVYKYVRSLQLISKNDVVFDSSMSSLNFNWAGQLDVPNPAHLGNNDGICLHAVIQNCVFPGGDITLCGMVDVNKKMIIGNMFETSLKDIYNGSKYVSYMEHLPELCKKCTEYETKYNETEDVNLHENQLNKNR